MSPPSQGLFAKLLPAGFYYKTFMWPRRWWDTYERFIRRAAGLGYSPRAPDPDYLRKNQRGLRCPDRRCGTGGHRRSPGGRQEWRARSAGRRTIRARAVLCCTATRRSAVYLAMSGGVSRWPRCKTYRKSHCCRVPRCSATTRTTGWACWSVLPITCPTPGGMQPRQRLWRVRANRVILAAGAIERPLVFCNNDRPGVMLASAVSTYIKRYAVRPGTRAVVFTNNDSCLSDRAGSAASRRGRGRCRRCPR